MHNKYICISIIAKHDGKQIASFKNKSILILYKSQYILYKHTQQYLQFRVEYEFQIINAEKKVG